MRTGKVYIVFVAEELRYVGQTWVSLTKRLTKHLNSESWDQSHRANLFRKCKRLGTRVRIEQIGNNLFTQADLDYCEKYWIKYFQQAGCRLVNVSEGGGTGRPRVNTVIARFRRMTGIQEDDEKFICISYPKMNTHELAKKFKVNHQCIANVLRRNGIKLRSNKEAQGGLSCSEESQVVEDYLRGSSGPELEVRYGVSNPTIYGILQKHGIATRSMSEALMILNQAQVKEMFRKYSKGVPAPDMAKEAGISYPVILRAFRKFGYPLKKYWRIASSDGLIFKTVEEAARHYQLSAATVRTSFTKTGCRVTFRRTPPDTL